MQHYAYPFYPSFPRAAKRKAVRLHPASFHHFKSVVSLRALVTSFCDIVYTLTKFTAKSRGCFSL